MANQSASGMLRRSLALAVLATVALGCGSQDRTAGPATTGASNPTRPGTVVPTANPTGTVEATVTLEEFAAAADIVCVKVFPIVNALPDPDGDGGQKPLGLGAVVRTWADDLAAVQAPADIADRWAKGTALLRRSGVRLEDAERLAAAGDAAGSGAAQSEALWSLQPEAADIIQSIGAPFKACFVE